MSDEIVMKFIKEFLIPAIKWEFKILKDRVTKLEKEKKNEDSKTK